jgi:hypothetical protein
MTMTSITPSTLMAPYSNSKILKFAELSQIFKRKRLRKKQQKSFINIFLSIRRIVMIIFSTISKACWNLQILTIS